MNTLTVLGAEIRRISSLAVQGDSLTRAVPTCPGMDVGELLRHLGSVYGCVLQGITTNRIPLEWQRRPPQGAGVREWFAGQAARLHTALGAVPADSICSAWWPRHGQGTFWRPQDQRMGYWRRRMAHETTIHRVDVENANGTPSPISAAFALDGVTEALDVVLRHHFDGAWESPGTKAVVHVAPTKRGRPWRVQLAEHEIRVSREADDTAFADAAIHGDPAAVYLWLWGRAPDATITVDGDRAAVAVLRQALNRAMQ